MVRQRASPAGHLILTDPTFPRRAPARLPVVIPTAGSISSSPHLSDSPRRAQLKSLFSSVDSAEILTHTTSTVTVMPAKGLAILGAGIFAKEGEWPDIRTRESSGD